jgi:hypothetical protein
MIRADFNCPTTAIGPAWAPDWRRDRRLDQAGRRRKIAVSDTASSGRIDQLSLTGSLFALSRRSIVIRRRSHIELLLANRTALAEGRRRIDSGPRRQLGSTTDELAMNVIVEPSKDSDVVRQQ